MRRPPRASHRPRCRPCGFRVLEPPWLSGHRTGDGRRGTAQDVVARKYPAAQCRMPALDACVEKRHGHSGAVESRQLDGGPAACVLRKLRLADALGADRGGINGPDRIDTGDASDSLQLGKRPVVQGGREAVHGAGEGIERLHVDPALGELREQEPLCSLRLRGPATRFGGRGDRAGPPPGRRRTEPPGRRSSASTAPRPGGGHRMLRATPRRHRSRQRPRLLAPVRP